MTMTDEEAASAFKQNYLYWAERLPEASATRAYAPSNNNDILAQCHGCGKCLPANKLKRCIRCKRVHYCSQDCQILDWKAPRFHKRSCQPNLLDLAMSNLPRWSSEKKMQLRFSGQTHMIPNSHLSQTINKVSCDTVGAFLAAAEKELVRIGELVMMNRDEAGATRGHTQVDFVDNEYGLDVGIETLCLALNLWPGVATVNSCSGLHAGAWVVLEEGKPCNYELFVVFMCDDPKTLLEIQTVAETGALGIPFEVQLCGPETDKIGNVDGFASIDCVLEESKMCRSMCRRIIYSSEPFDKLDSVVWLIDDGKTPLLRVQYMLVGCFGLGLNLLKANAALKLSQQEAQKLDDLVAAGRQLRETQINRFSHLKGVLIQQMHA